MSSRVIYSFAPVTRFCRDDEAMYSENSDITERIEFTYRLEPFNNVHSIEFDTEHVFISTLIDALRYTTTNAMI